VRKSKSKDSCHLQNHFSAASPETSNQHTTEITGASPNNTIQTEASSIQSPDGYAPPRWAMTPSPTRKPYHISEKIGSESNVEHNQSHLSASMQRHGTPNFLLGSLDEAGIPGEDPRILWKQSFFQKRDELQQALKEVEWARRQAELIVEEKVLAASLVCLCVDDDVLSSMS
jgi:hypothetical protein